jgi:hypothetical protein
MWSLKEILKVLGLVLLFATLKCLRWAAPTFVVGALLYAVSSGGVRTAGLVIMVAGALAPICYP